MLGVVTDGTEVDGPSSSPTTEFSAGFYIYYSQVAC